MNRLHIDVMEQRYKVLYHNKCHHSLSLFQWYPDYTYLEGRLILKRVSPDKEKSNQNKLLIQLNRKLRCPEKVLDMLRST